MSRSDANNAAGATTRRVEELVFALDALPDPAAATAARELVQLVLELHGSALNRMMEVVAGDANGGALLARLGDDEGVRGVLLLHGLHPDDFEARVRRAGDRLHASLAVQGVSVKSVEVEALNVHVQLGLSDAGRFDSADAAAIRREIEQAIVDAAPEVAGVDIDGMPQHVSYVAASSITVTRHDKLASSVQG